MILLKKIDLFFHKSQPKSVVPCDQCDTYQQCLCTARIVGAAAIVGCYMALREAEIDLLPDDDLLMGSLNSFSMVFFFV